MGLSLETNVSLRPYNTFGVDARAALFARITAVEELAALAGDLRVQGLPRLVLGGGSNVLFIGDVEGLVLKIDLPGVSEIGETDDCWLVRVGAGENWHATVARLLALGRPGLENLALIPGQVGAAPIQNIGAYGLEVAERLHAVYTWDLDEHRCVDMTPAECNFAYRDSAFKHQWAGRRIVLGIALALPKRWSPVTAYAEVE
ncbi:MAG TPA: FAD-binding protein, partial [Burkholderiaceae bacterium]|nr:FAD-binding protein [Burkholderiaceae bacterium]